MNTDELEAAVYQAERRVLGIQAKLHRWAREDPHRRFDDLFNLVADPAFLLVAWDRVRGNKGAATPGVDGQTVSCVEAVWGVEDFLAELRSQVSTMGLRLSQNKTLITHIEVGLDFLGWRIQRHRKRGTNRYYVYTYPARKAVTAVTAKVKTWCRRMDTNQPLDVLLLQLNRMLRGWCAYFRPGVSHAAFKYLSSYAWARVIGWLRRKHRRSTWKALRRRYCDGRWWPTGEQQRLFDPAKVRTTRYCSTALILRGFDPGARVGEVEAQGAVEGLFGGA